jgi:hypothetical protein
MKKTQRMQSRSEGTAEGVFRNLRNHVGDVVMFLIAGLGDDELEWAGGLARLCADRNHSGRLANSSLTVRRSRVQITPGPPSISRSLLILLC